MEDINLSEPAAESDREYEAPDMDMSPGTLTVEKKSASHFVGSRDREFASSKSVTLRMKNNAIDFEDLTTKKNIDQLLHKDVDILEFANLDIYDKFLIQQM